MAVTEAGDKEDGGTVGPGRLMKARPSVSPARRKAITPETARTQDSPGSANSEDAHSGLEARVGDAASLEVLAADFVLAEAGIDPGQGDGCHALPFAPASHHLPTLASLTDMHRLLINTPRTQWKLVMCQNKITECRRRILGNMTMTRNNMKI